MLPLQVTGTTWDWLKLKLDTKKEATAMVDPQEDTRSRDEVSSHVVPSERNEYPVKIAVDFRRLRPDTLHKYMVCHGMSEGSSESNEQLAVNVARHFSEECKKTDERSSIASFVTYLTGSNDTLKAARLLQAQPLHQFSSKCQDFTDDKENQSRQMTKHHFESVDTFQAPDADADRFDCCHEDRERKSVSLKRRLVKLDAKACARSGQSRSGSSETEGMQMKKKRKGRIYCICKGTSFGNMIACDNKKCLDRSNWYHMDCVDLDPYEEAPKIWYCPACQENDSANIPENQFRKPAASVTYGDMISHALNVLPGGKGSFKEICDFVENEYESQLNWKLESDQRKSPVWKSSVRKILFSNVRFQKHPKDKGMFCLAA